MALTFFKKSTPNFKKSTPFFRREPTAFFLSASTTSFLLFHRKKHPLVGTDLVSVRIRKRYFSRLRTDTRSVPTVEESHKEMIIILRALDSLRMKFKRISVTQTKKAKAKFEQEEDRKAKCRKDGRKRYPAA